MVAIAAGFDENLALRRDGTVWEWWQTFPESSGFAPAPVRGLSEVVAVATDGDRSLALKQDGAVWAWGSWPESFCSPAPLVPAQVPGLDGVAAIGLGSWDGLAAKGDGTVWEWGWGRPPDGSIQQTPTEVSGLGGVRALAGGSPCDDFSFLCPHWGHRLALKTDGTVWTWGAGPLGDGRTGSGRRMTPGQVGGVSGVVGIAAGDSYALAVKRDGTVWGWGTGPLGYEGTANRTTPVQVIQPGSPDLAVAIRHEGDFAIDRQGVYNVTITNVGLSATAGIITVTDSLPPGLTYVSGIGNGWSCSAEDQEVTCTNPGPVDGGASSTITLTVAVGPAALPGMTNLVTVSNQSDRNISNNTADNATVVQPLG